MKYIFLLLLIACSPAGKSDYIRSMSTWEYGTDSPTYYTIGSDWEGNYQLWASAEQSRDTLTIGQEWPKVRDSVRVIHAFGRTYILEQQKQK